MIFLRRTWHLVSIVALIGTLVSFGCALSANADQREPDDPANNTTPGNGPSTPPPSVDSGASEPRAPETQSHQQSAHDLREFVIERLLDPVTWFTGGLLLFSWLQYQVTRRQADIAEDQNRIVNRQNRIMNRQNRIMKAQTALMEASANTLHTVERAIVKMSHNPPGIVWTAYNRYEIGLTARNFGNTPGRVTATVMKPIVLKIDELLPPVPDYRYDTGTNYAYANYSSGTEAILVTNDKIYFPHHHDGIDREGITNRAKRLYVIGYVDYIDTFGIRHRGGYARMYLPEHDRREDWPDGPEGDKLFAKRSNLVFVPQPRYNYDRKRDKGEGEDWDEEVYGKAPP